MDQQIARNIDGQMANSPTAAMDGEVAVLRKRLAALEASAGKAKSRTILGLVLLTLAVVWMVSERTFVVQSKSDVTGPLTIGAAQGQQPDPLTITKEGNVGIGTTAPTNKLSVAGNADFSGNVDIGTTGSANKLSVAGNVSIRRATPGVALEVGQNQAIRLGNANISSGGDFVHLSNHTWFDGSAWRSDGTAGALYQISAQTHNWYLHDGKGVFEKVMTIQPNGNVGIGNITPNAKLEVAGNMRVAGTLISQGRYQRDDGDETTYEVSPRYHISLTAATYGGRTRLIPQQVINDLCGDQDGCQFRLGMTRWDNNTETETASQTALLYYSPANGRWRTNNGSGGDLTGVDGNRVTQHVSGELWGTCYFTDGPYSGYKEQGDATIGMYLLVWNNYKNSGRTCELTLID